jgi:hypothetical protein
MSARTTPNPSRPPAVQLMRKLGLEPDPWQVEVLEGGHPRLLLNCCRQARKSTAVALLGLAEAIYLPGSKVLLLSRSLRQSAELFRIVTGFYRRLGAPMRQRQTVEELQLENYSPDMEVDVEVLDVSDDEARALLLSIDPLAALAQPQAQLHERLRELTPTDSEDLRAVWQAAARACLEGSDERVRPEVETIPEQWFVLVTCRDEKQQVELLARLSGKGLECRALLS